MARQYSTGEVWEYAPEDDYKPGDPVYPLWDEEGNPTKDNTGWGYNPQDTIDAIKLAEERRQAGVAYGQEEPYSTVWEYNNPYYQDNNSRGGWEYEPYNPAYFDTTYQDEADLWYGMNSPIAGTLQNPQGSGFRQSVDDYYAEQARVQAIRDNWGGREYIIPNRYSGAYYQRPDAYVAKAGKQAAPKATGGDYNPGYGRGYGGGGGGSGSGQSQAVDWYYGMLNWRI